MIHLIASRPIDPVDPGRPTTQVHWECVPPPSRRRPGRPGREISAARRPRPSCFKITPLRAADAASYYLEAVASGGEDYYLRSSEAPGVWVGRGAKALDLRGVARPEQLGALLRQEDPRTGETLAARSIKRAGFDLTLSAPKSVSLVWALRTPEALLLGDHHVYAEAGYTALTRGRTRNHAYVLVDDSADVSPAEELRRRLDRIGATPAAVDVPRLA